MKSSLGRSIRLKVVVASVLVQVVMLSLLVANSVRLIESNLVEQAQLRLSVIAPLLNASLGVPLAQRDHVSAEEILQESQSKNDLAYLVLFDNGGKIVASRGWDYTRPLPSLDQSVTDKQVNSDARFDTQIPIQIAGQTYGVLRYGISTDFLSVAKSNLLRQSLFIAALGIFVSVALLALIGYWLTRHLLLLIQASDSVAAGNFDIHVKVHSDDELGHLAQAFNTMAGTLRNRIEALSESEAKFHAIADYTYDCELWIDPVGKLVWVNQSVERMTGYSPQECLEMEDFPIKIVAPQDVERVRAELKRALTGGMGKEFEFRIKHKEGAIFWVAADWQSIYSKQGIYLGIRSSIRDISERRHLDEALRDKIVELEQSEDIQRRLYVQAQQEQARMASLLSAMNIGILFENSDNRIIYFNPAFRRIWMIDESVELVGRYTHEALEHSAHALAKPDHFSKYFLQVNETHEIGENTEVTMSDGRVVTQVSHQVHSQDSRFIGRLWIYEDITRERQTAEQLIYLAERDSLTGLYNRHRFQEELSRMVVEVERRNTQGALLFFDLDEFKYINDTFGHRTGDAMLIRVAGEISTLTRRNEICSRLGGDEFAVLVPDASEDQAKSLADRIVRAISQIPFRFEGHKLRLSTSLGIALFPQHASNTEELIAHADTAMYQAKEAGKNAWRIYRADLDATREMVDRLTWNDRINRALEDHALCLHFQGIYDAQNGALSHLEVLVRMQDEAHENRIIMPGHFIPVAERSGKIVDIDRWVIRQTIALLAKSPNTPPMAVNISGRSFDEPTLPKYIGDQLEFYKVDPSRLRVELTETAAVSDLHDAQRFIEALHQTGCTVCLDDFGVGFSSFAYLKHLEADMLKIDGLFIRDLPNDHDNQLFVKAIVDIARGLKKETVAEFVEDRETLEMLKKIGVDMVQGYYMDTPRNDHPAVKPGFEK